MKIMKDTVIVVAIISLVGFILPWMISSKSDELVVIAVIALISVAIAGITVAPKLYYKIIDKEQNDE